jgi:hypothetical protein
MVFLFMILIAVRIAEERRGIQSGGAEEVGAEEKGALVFLGVAATLSSVPTSSAPPL